MSHSTRFKKGQSSGKNNAFFGRKHTPESKLKMSLARKGRKFKPLSEEHKRKLSELKKGKPGRKMSEEEKAWRSKFMKLPGTFVPSTKGRKLTPEHRKKIAIANRGEKSHFWKGGVAVKNDRLNTSIRNSFEYRQWRSDILTRDEFQCQRCGIKSIRFDIHHIKPLSKILSENNICSIETAKACDELWNINNGITLCVHCHKLTDSYGGKINNDSKKHL